MIPKVARAPFQPAFYARTGSALSDLLALLHVPYTAWHLSYVAFGAALAPGLDGVRLVATLAAFFFGTGIAAHALDELNGRPLRTSLSDRTLLGLGALGIGAGVALGVAGALVVSPWALLWAAAGTSLMLAYVLEWHPVLHSDAAFGLAWGAFPVLVGYWAQTEQVGAAVSLVAVGATLLSLAQRALSTPARYTRRRAVAASVVFERAEGRDVWPGARLLDSWETPLKLLSGAVVALACGLLAMRV